MTALILLVIFLLSSLWIIYPYGQVESYWIFNLVAILTFSIQSFLVSIAAKRLKNSENKQSFIKLIFTNMALRIVISAILIGAYFYIIRPDNGIFVLSFIAVYIGFTVYETYVLDNIARS
ncbi:MAG TPA: hypothetical protein PK246_06195 [Saprospiraceae bacterium]|nr:hypothetical protein [Saprospiraceae bacterium]